MQLVRHAEKAMYNLVVKTQNLQEKFMFRIKSALDDNNLPLKSMFWIFPKAGLVLNWFHNIARISLHKKPWISNAADENQRMSRVKGMGRPSKKDRRDIEDFLDDDA
jgi:hypothetical protein